MHANTRVRILNKLYWNGSLIEISQVCYALAHPFCPPLPEIYRFSLFAFCKIEKRIINYFMAQMQCTHWFNWFNWFEYWISFTLELFIWCLFYIFHFRYASNVCFYLTKRIWVEAGFAAIITITLMWKLRFTFVLANRFVRSENNPGHWLTVLCYFSINFFELTIRVDCVNFNSRWMKSVLRHMFYNMKRINAFLSENE